MKVCRAIRWRQCFRQDNRMSRIKVKSIRPILQIPLEEKPRRARRAPARPRASPLAATKRLKIGSCESGECFSPPPFFSPPDFLRRRQKADYGEKQALAGVMWVRVDFADFCFQLHADFDENSGQTERLRVNYCRRRHREIGSISLCLLFNLR